MSRVFAMPRRQWTDGRPFHDPDSSYRYHRAQGMTASEAMNRVRFYFSEKRREDRAGGRLGGDGAPELRAEAGEANSTLQRLAAELDKARQRIVELEDRLREHIISRSNAHDKVWASIGLAPNAPDFLLRAARTAFRKWWHPDVHPPEERARATKQFQRHEGVFDQLFRQRGLT